MQHFASTGTCYLTIVTIHFVSLKYYPNRTCLTGAADLSEQLACSLGVSVMQGNRHSDDNLIHTSMFIWYTGSWWYTSDINVVIIDISTWQASDLQQIPTWSKLLPPGHRWLTANCSTPWYYLHATMGQVGLGLQGGRSITSDLQCHCQPQVWSAVFPQLGTP